MRLAVLASNANGSIFLNEMMVQSDAVQLYIIRVNERFTASQIFKERRGGLNIMISSTASDHSLTFFQECRDHAGPSCSVSSGISVSTRLLLTVIRLYSIIR